MKFHTALSFYHNSSLYALNCDKIIPLLVVIWNKWTDGRTDKTHLRCALCVNSKQHLKGRVYLLTYLLSGFGGLEVACWPLVPKFAGSNPTEAVGFFRAKKSSARLLTEGK